MATAEPQSTLDLQPREERVSFTMLDEAGREQFFARSVAIINAINMDRVLEWSDPPGPHQASARVLCRRFLEQVKEQLPHRKRLNETTQAHEYHDHLKLTIDGRARYAVERFTPMVVTKINDFPDWPANHEKHRMETALVDTFRDDYIGVLGKMIQDRVGALIDELFVSHPATRYAIGLQLEPLQGLHRDHFRNRMLELAKQAADRVDQSILCVMAEVSPDAVNPRVVEKLIHTLAAETREEKAAQITQAYMQAADLGNLTLTNAPDGGLKALFAQLADQQKIAAQIDKEIHPQTIDDVVEVEFRDEHGPGRQYRPHDTDYAWRVQRRNDITREIGAKIAHVVGELRETLLAMPELPGSMVVSNMGKVTPIFEQSAEATGALYPQGSRRHRLVRNMPFRIVRNMMITAAKYPADPKPGL